jgi:hypothetical protein
MDDWNFSDRPKVLPDSVTIVADAGRQLPYPE